MTDDGPVTDAVRPRRILVVDNYDSFVFNLVQYLAQLGAECAVLRNDEVAPRDARGYDGVLLSPGPGTPEQAGVCVDLVREVARRGAGPRRLPRAPGDRGRVRRRRRAGARAAARQDQRGRSTRAPASSPACRRRSPRPATTRWPCARTACRPSSRSPAGRPAASSWRCGTATWRVEGVQFHPESVLTEGGHRMLATWLVTCGDPDAPARAEGLAPVAAGSSTGQVTPRRGDGVRRQRRLRRGGRRASGSRAAPSRR